jgi:Kef-type K+ transport system membrane component KefB/nucleotide-binding universal stress UspA family protein
VSDLSDVEPAVHQRETEDAAAGSGFGRSSRTRVGLFYGGLTLVAIVALNFLLRAGSGLESPKPVGSEAPQGEESIHVHEVFWKLLLASVVIIAAARGVGYLFRKIGQPQVMGEIVAGILLGPSLLGVVWPSGQESLFSADVLPFIEVLAQLGLVFFMFLIGLELDVNLIRGRGQAAAAVSHASIVVPFVSGVGLAFAIFTTLGSEEGDFVPFALFLGASMSITAFPVLARILTERGLNKTRLGAVTITCAAIDDVTAWCLLAVVVAVAAASGLGGAFLTIGLAALFIVGMIVVVRPLVGRLAAYQEENGGLSATMLSIVFGGLLLSSLATDRIGIHAIFGAFLFGAIMPQSSDFIHELTVKLEDFAVIFLLPLFFAFSGLRTEIGQLGTDPQLWLYCAAIVGVAIIGKWGGSAVAARMVGLSWRESLGLGILMNCRGLTELVILNIGLDLGVIPPALFAMLVIMALVTTFMTTPILSAIYPKHEQERMIAEESGADLDGVFRVLVHVPQVERGFEMVSTALSFARSQDQPVQVLLVRTIRPAESALRSGLRQESRTDRAAAALRPLVQFVEGAGYEAVPVVLATRSAGDAIVQLAADREPDLVLMSTGSAAFGGRLLGGSLGRVLRDAPSDVAVLVDPMGRGTTLRKDGQVLVPFGKGFHEQAGLELALRLAKSSGASVHLLGGGDDEASVTLAEVAAEAYERSGVWTTADVVTDDVVGALVRSGREADLVVLAVSETWADEGKASLGGLREAVAGATSTPMLVVRRHGQAARRGPRKWFGRRAEWMDDATGEVDIRSSATERVAEGEATITR